MISHGHFSELVRWSLEHDWLLSLILLGISAIQQNICFSKISSFFDSRDVNLCACRPLSKILWRSKNSCIHLSNNILETYKIPKIVANVLKIQLFSKNLPKFTKSSERPGVSRHECFVLLPGKVWNIRSPYCPPVITL